MLERIDAWGAAGGVGEVVAEVGVCVDLDEQIGDRHPWQPGGEGVSLGDDVGVDRFRRERRHLQLPVGVEGDEPVAVGEQLVERAKVVIEIDVEGFESFGVGGGLVAERPEFVAHCRPHDR